ncbi:MAG: insecticidal delta-endotoxin Cry8Ea1 family protein [Rhodanobacter sp.]
MNDSELAKVIAQAVAGKVPYVGGLLSGLIGVFWPSDQPDIWDQIKAQVQTLVEQDIAQNNLDQLQLTLQGLKDDIDDYLALTDPGEKQDKLVSIDTTIVAAVPTFLNGDPARGFSCFWGMALLHIAVRNDLCQLFGNGGGNQTLYQQAVMAYCSFADVALGCLYNDRMGQVAMSCMSNNVPGKASEWRIDVAMTDGATGDALFTYQKFYANGQWNDGVLDRDTAQCNQGIRNAWNRLASSVQANFASLAGDAVQTMQAAVPRSAGQGEQLLQSMMDTAEYNTYSTQYVPYGLAPKQAPLVQLDPFR